MSTGKPPAITDPLAHAAAGGGSFYEAARGGAWEDAVVFHTTNEFHALDGGYVRHCAPTAITNLLLAFEKRAPFKNRRHLIPARVFTRVASYGIQKRIYWNTAFLKVFGGTLNLLTGKYIRDVFRMYGRKDLRMKGARPAWRSFLKRALDEGALLYMELMWHPLYGNHHVIVYGYRELKDKAGQKRLLYLAAVDGWSAEPRYLCMPDLRFSHFLPVFRSQETVSGKIKKIS